MYTVKEICQALLACKNLRQFMLLLRAINFLIRTENYTEEQRYAIEAAALVKRRTFKFRK